MKRKIVFVCAAAMLLVLIAGCSQVAGNTQSTSQPRVASDQSETSSPLQEQQTKNLRTEYPVKIMSKSPEGDEFEQVIEAAPQRVVTGNASTTELMFELGLGDRIIGIMALDNAPPKKWAADYAKLAVLGDKKTMSREIIVGAEPDLILGRCFTFTAEAFGTIDSYNNMGIPVYTQISSYLDIDQSLENVIQDVRNIGIIFDVQEKAESYATELENRLAAVKEMVVSVQDEEQRGAVIMTAYKDRTFTVFGANAMLQTSILKTLNLTNIMPSGQGGITLENLIVADPDLIIYILSDRNAETDAVAVEAILAEEILKTVPAVTDGMIIELQYDDMMDYGTRTFDALEAIAEFMYR